MSNQNLNILKTLTPDQALDVLRLLAKEDKNIQNKIEKIAEDYLSQVDVEETAKKVFSDLNSLDVYDVWDDAGHDHCGGYQEPYEVAWDMVEETLESYIQQLKKYIKLKMPIQAKKYCQGIIKGIENYQQKSKSEFKDCAGEDVFSENKNTIVDIWKKFCRDSKKIIKMKKL